MHNFSPIHQHSESQLSRSHLLAFFSPTPLTPSHPPFLNSTFPPHSRTVNIAVQHMQVLLEMDFLFTLKDFADEIVSSSVYIAKRSQPKGDTHPPPAEKQERPPVKTAVKESSSQMHVDFKVEHPSITLLAKTGSGNEDALLMKVICQMSYAIHGMYSVYTQVCIPLLPFPL